MWDKLFYPDRRTKATDPETKMITAGRKRKKAIEKHGMTKRKLQRFVWGMVTIQGSMGLVK